MGLCWDSFGNMLGIVFFFYVFLVKFSKVFILGLFNYENNCNKERKIKKKKVND